MVEQSLQALRLCWIELRGPGDAALQVFAPVRLALAVLGGGALHHALMEDGLESIELFARQVCVVVHDDVAHGLASPRAEAA